MKKIICLLLIVFFSVSAYAKDRDLILYGEFFINIEGDPFPDKYLNNSSSEDFFNKQELALKFKEMATWVFSGMIWGFDFVYTPSDKARSISEYFEIIPRRQIDGLDIDLGVLETRNEGQKVIALISCYPDKIARAEYYSWRTLLSPSQSIGRAKNILLENIDEVDCYKNAVKNASKEAIRSLLRTVTKNKPREVRGSFVFNECPRVSFKENSWIASTKIYVRVDEIIEYGAY